MKKLILFLLLWPAFLLPAEAQRTLHGKISDAGGDPLPGAAIKVAGTETGFIADTDGRYEIRGVRFPARIIVSYIGYADTEIDLTGNEAVPYDIVLDDSKNILDEVVVVGFGTQKKSTLSGSVGIVDGATLNQRPVVSAANALQGADPSVYITTSNGSANSSASINIRGTLSVGGSGRIMFSAACSRKITPPRGASASPVQRSFPGQGEGLTRTLPSGSKETRGISPQISRTSGPHSVASVR